MDYLDSKLPMELLNMVLEYSNPMKELHEKKQKKINRSFYMACKKNLYDIKNIILNIGFGEFTHEEINNIRYPSTSKMLEDIEYYKNNRKSIKKFLKYN